jgi:hypothetical protein
LDPGAAEAFLTDPLGETAGARDLRLAGLAFSRLLAETFLDRPLLMSFDPSGLSPVWVQMMSSARRSAIAARSPPAKAS